MDEVDSHDDDCRDDLEEVYCTDELVDDAVEKMAHTAVVEDMNMDTENAAEDSVDMELDRNIHLDDDTDLNCHFDCCFHFSNYHAASVDDEEDTDREDDAKC